MLRFPSFPREFQASLVAALVLAGVAVPSTAVAHGRFPGANGIVFDPTNLDHAVVRTTYGLYDNETASAGPAQGWRFICSSAAGFDSNKEDPSLTFAGERLLVATFGGLFVGSPDRCNYEPSAVVGERYVVGLAALPRFDAPAKGSPILALSSNGKGLDSFEVKLFESTDEGVSFHELPTPFTPDFLALSVVASPKAGDPLAWGTLYVSGRDGTEAGGYHAVVFRSDDGGVTWKRNVVQGLDGILTLPYLQGVSPLDGQTVYVAATLDAPPTRKQSNLVSHDGGATFSAYFSADELLPGFATSPDGSSIAFGGEKTGLRVVGVDALEGAASVAPIQKTRVACLNWMASGLYACGNAFVDGFSVGKSTDGGKTFAPLMQLTSACGPRECTASSDVGSQCVEVWAKEAKELVAPASCTEVPPTEEPNETGGCDCSTGSASHGRGPKLAWAGWLGALGLGFVLRRRR